ncbi:transcription factor bHLH51-like protein [Cinnamomum micranthum f. kanehirae]|uniref:Transcription factor bHLH51-like protein n=1 Tax=Cinnamomum micranthum f. kanehirae TaxID=337451 RepID=A0A3S3Q509_9MAGN|nr:transcription factor bHLH51-like protein [Cinnamomum micranthum f. kanehirae]
MVLPWPPHVSTSSCQVGGSETSKEAKALISSQSHSQAEKRRRERINTHLSTLRRLVPSATKLDKATLLGRVIDHVKELKRKALEIGNSFTVPTETDDVTVECDRNGALKDRFIIRASLCCDDRPELYTDLIQALHGLKLRTVRADMATLGGRVKNVLILSTKVGEEGACLSTLKDSLKEVLGRIVFTDVSSQNTNLSKRQRTMPSFWSN